ncbi:MAG: aspartyl protease family protein [Gemmatimonadales bacterium]
MTALVVGTLRFGSVGISYVNGTVRGPGGAEQRVRFLIDSGAMYSLLPERVWKAIGLQPKREEEFYLADGTSVRLPVSECVISLPQGEHHSPVILGDPGDVQPLLGVVTLEVLGLVFDPFHQTLHPMRLRL